MLAGFKIRKAAHVTAYFALKAGGKINILKIAKLLYLAEREFMSLYDVPMLYDRLVSMDHGPVTSVSLNLINGTIEDHSWKTVIRGRENYDIAVCEGVDFAGLDELSRADCQVLDLLWERFGHFTQYELRDYTHQHCPEWENPYGSSERIPHERVFKFLGKEAPEALAEDIEIRRHQAKMFELAS